MTISLDRICMLDSNKTYYLANSTGEIKEATWWQKIKCITGLGDGQAKVARLAEAIKASLLDSAGQLSNAALNESMRTLNLGKPLSGRKIKAIASNFITAQATQIAKKSAVKVSKDEINQSMKMLKTCLGFDNGTRKDLYETLHRRAKTIIENPPMKLAHDGLHQVLDADALRDNLKEAFSELERLIVNVSGSARLGHPKFDVAFRDHFFDTLYNADGTRTEKTIDDLLPAADVRFNRMYAAGIAKKCDDQSLPDCIRKGIAACGNDVAALNILLSRPEKFLFGGDCNLRSPDAVEKRVRDLVANLKELRNATKDKGLRESGEIMLLGLAGKSLPPGSIAAMVEATKAIVPTALLSIRADSAAAAIHKAVREALATMEKVLEKAGITGKLLFDHDDATAYRRFVIRNILAHLDEQTLRAFARALSSGEAVTLNVLYNDFSASRYDIDEKHIVNEVERRASTYADVLLKLKTVTDEALGMPMETIPLEGDAIDPDKPIVGTVYRDLVKDAKGRAQAGNADAPQAGNRT